MGHGESADTRASRSRSSLAGVWRSPASRSTSAPRSGTSRGTTTRLKAGRLSASGSPVRSNRMPRGAAMGRSRSRFRSERAARRSPLRICRYASWPPTTRNPTPSTIARSRSRARGMADVGRDADHRRSSRPTGQASGGDRQDAVVTGLRHDDPREQLAQGRRVVEGLEEGEAREPVDDRGQRSREPTGTIGRRTRIQRGRSPAAKPISALDRAWSPSGPPATASCASPSANPVRQPASGPKRSASSTVSTIGTSGTTPPTPNTGTTVHWTSAPPLTARM